MHSLLNMEITEAQCGGHTHSFKHVTLQTISHMLTKADACGRYYILLCKLQFNQQWFSTTSTSPKADS